MIPFYRRQTEAESQPFAQQQKGSPWNSKPRVLDTSSSDDTSCQSLILEIFSLPAIWIECCTSPCFDTAQVVLSGQTCTANIFPFSNSFSVTASHNLSWEWQLAEVAMRSPLEACDIHPLPRMPSAVTPLAAHQAFCWHSKRRGFLSLPLIPFISLSLLRL